MGIDYDSRYAEVPVVVDGNNEYYALRKPINNDVRDDDIYHTVDIYDRIDVLAREYLGHHKYWWVIADYNDIDFPLELEVGTVLRIPSRVNFEMNIIG